MYKQKRNKITSIYSDIFFNKEGVVALHKDDAQFQHLQRYLSSQRDSYILDAGCGDCRYLRKLHEIGFRNAHGIDLFKKVPSSKNYICSSIDAIPFHNNTFDLVYSFSVIFYLDNPMDALSEYNRILRPGGYAVISCHTKYSLFTLDRIIRRRVKPSTVRHLDGVTFYSPQEYKKMMEIAGFRIVEIDGFQLSYCIVPFIKKIKRVIYDLFGLYSASCSSICSETILKTKNQRPNALRWLRSNIAYHTILVGLKTGPYGY